ncbi:hypothetical protein [Paenibacillus humicus]|uniref:hypothetical protein n=1 Tax=Paenibacillus humicus TaxID=412861 RepID=UPI003D2C0834
MNQLTEVKVGIQGYEIKQGLDESNMTLSLVFANPEGSCEAYVDFLEKFEVFLINSGYSFKS